MFYCEKRKINVRHWLGSHIQFYKRYNLLQMLGYNCSVKLKMTYFHLFKVVREAVRNNIFKLRNFLFTLKIFLLYTVKEISTVYMDRNF